MSAKQKWAERFLKRATLFSWCFNLRYFIYAMVHNQLDLKYIKSRDLRSFFNINIYRMSIKIILDNECFLIEDQMSLFELWIKDEQVVCLPFNLWTWKSIEFPDSSCKSCSGVDWPGSFDEDLKSAHSHGQFNPHSYFITFFLTQCSQSTSTFVLELYHPS